MRKCLCLTLLLGVTGTVAVSALAAVPAVALAATSYYVSPSGSDSNAGTSTATPWKTIAKVNATTLSAGQSVLFQGGGTFTGELVPNGSGTSGAPTTYGSYGTGDAIINGLPGIYPGQSGPLAWVNIQNLTVDGGVAASADNNTGCVQTYGGGPASHITFNADEFRFCGYGYNGGRASDSNITIENSYIHDIDESGIVIGGPNHTSDAGGDVIQNNQIENTGTDNNAQVGSNAHGIYDNSVGSQVLDNDIGNFQTDGISVRFGGNVIEGNTIHDNHDSIAGAAEGIGYYNYDLSETPGQRTTTVAYNRIWNVPYGINLIGASGGSSVGPDNWKIVDNTFSGGVGAGGGSTHDCIDFASSMTSTSLIIQDNVFTGSFLSGCLALSHTPATFTENHNDWNSTGGAGQGDNGAGDITTAPDLSTAPAFAPNSGSPVINTGTTAIAGITWTHLCDGAVLDYCGSAPNMGAVTTASTPPPPPAPPPTAVIPVVPSGLTAVPASGSVALTWTPNPAANGVTHYNLYRTDQTASSPWATTTTTTTLTDTTNIVNGTKYCYQISATNTTGQSAKSTQVCATPPASVVPVPPVSSTPTAPTALVAAPGNGRVVLTWASNPAVQQVTDYNVYRVAQTFPGPWATITATTFTNIAEVVNGTRYCYQVSATNTTGASPKSTAVCATPGASATATVPSGPVGLKAVASNGGVVLTWTANPVVQQVTHYSVYRVGQTFPGPWATPTATTFTNTAEVVSGNRYCYQLSATNQIGEGPKSAPICIQL